MLATYALFYGIVPLLWQENRHGLFGLLLAGWFAFGLFLTFAFR